MPLDAHDASRTFDLLVVGEVNPDVVVTDPDPRPVFGQAERIVEGVRLAIGSSSAITACGAERLGLRVAMVGVVGDDALGRYMLDAMAARGVDVSAVRTDLGRPTGASVVLSDGRDRAILTALGTIGDVTESDVPDRLLSAARHLHIGSWFLQAGL
ncbi:MAG TPA: PfkB family carbohydrate kinase, partial [Candidatus Limnocylindrales bacterium]|nr:PfkB family carbohydrate kinase [Candidatus Limnocylindrales bacterium]